MIVTSSVFTIGHSNHSIERFIELLAEHGIDTVVDVRSMPSSRLHPQFNRGVIKAALAASEIGYVFLGHELGARSNDRSCYEDGKVRYRRLAETDLFRGGLARVVEGSEDHRIAIMCAEREPLDCHRMLLVGRELAAEGVSVAHIHADGHTESHDEAEERLVAVLKLPPFDMFRSHEDVIDEAYAKQERKVAYVDPDLVAAASEVFE